jgi:uncharacterized membrane protein
MAGRRSVTLRDGQPRASTGVVGLLQQHAQPAIAGTIVCGAVIAASGGKGLSIGALAMAVLGSSVVYWIAHLYTDTLAVVATRHQTLRAAAREATAHTWFLAAVSLIPLGVLVLSGLLGAETATAAYAALLATTVLLAAYSAMAARRGGLSTLGTVSAAIGGGVLGMTLMAIKALL